MLERNDAQVLAPDQDPFAAESLKRLAAAFGTPLLVVDLQRIERQYRLLAASLPGVELHYALKPLPHPAVVAALQRIGGSFDLATTGEIDVVRGVGVDARRCIHTHPIKRDVDIRNALDFGIDTFVADNPDELHKFAPYRQRCRLLLRISFRNADAVVDLSRKFGCDPAAVPNLIELAERIGLEIAGFSFHVGSQVRDPRRYVEAIEVCRTLAADAARGGVPLRVLDIGGGFPVAYRDEPVDIEAFCAPIRRALATLEPTMRVIAEPGRFIAAPAAVGIAAVIGRAQRDGVWWYYLDDGIYGSYSGQLFDHAAYPLEALVEPGPLQPSVLAGPTCDSIDVVNERVPMPALRDGDLIVGRVMGAYTWACATDFNFFPRAHVVALDRGRVHPS